MNGYLQIVLADDEANEFVTLGGAGFATMAETRRQFALVPAVKDSDLILDLVRGEGGIVDDKYIDHSTAERLLGDSFTNLVAAGKATK